MLRSVTGVFSLHENASLGRLAMVKSCLLLGRADVNGVWTELATTPLHAAAYNGHLSVVKYLYEVWAANPIVLSADGWTSLHCAAMNGYLPVVKYLIEEAHVRTSSESNEGWNCLHCAAANGFLPVVKYLIEKQNMDPEGTTFNEWTPLHWAVCNGYLNVVKYLLGTGRVSVLTKTGCGSHLVHLAARQGHAFLLQYFLSDEFTEAMGAPLPVDLLVARNDAGMDAFTLACLKGKLSVVEVLVAQLGRDAFTSEQLQRAHDLHQAAAKQDKIFINLQLIKYLREWMQELEYHDEIASESSVEVLTMRELLSSDDRDRSLQKLHGGDAAAPTVPSVPEARELDDDDEDEEEHAHATDDDDDDDDAIDDIGEYDEYDDDQEEDEPAGVFRPSPSPSPPTLDNAHLARSHPAIDAPHEPYSSPSVSLSSRSTGASFSPDASPEVNQ